MNIMKENVEELSSFVPFGCINNINVVKGKKNQFLQYC